MERVTLYCLLPFMLPLRKWNGNNERPLLADSSHPETCRRPEETGL